MAAKMKAVKQPDQSLVFLSSYNTMGKGERSRAHGRRMLTGPFSIRQCSILFCPPSSFSPLALPWPFSCHLNIANPPYRRIYPMAK
jgi:hypothetical protein